MIGKEAGIESLSSSLSRVMAAMEALSSATKEVSNGTASWEAGGGSEWTNCSSELPKEFA